MTIKKAIEAELKHRGWSRYRLAEELKGKMPERTVYAYLSGERDLSSERASVILKALGLKIRR
jgi:ribosome-binding protein aMBF1 (putative translation factor)